MGRRAATVGQPTAGNDAKGDPYLAGAGTLFICTKATTATAAAVWKQVGVTAV